jgi:hypothetical protein
VKNDKKWMVGLGLALAGSYFLLRRSPAVAAATVPSTGTPPKEGSGIFPPEPKPTQGVFGGPTGPGHHGPGGGTPSTQISDELRDALCNSPLQIQPVHVAQLLHDYAIPAYRQATGDELAPSETQTQAGLSAAAASITQFCNASGTAALIAKGARDLVMGNRYGKPIESTTAKGRLCLGHKLDTTQSLTLLIDVGVNALRHDGTVHDITNAVLEDCQHGGDAAVSMAADVAIGAVLIYGAL